MPINTCCRITKGKLYIGPYQGAVNQPTIPALTQWMQANFDAGEAHDVELTLDVEQKTLPSMRNRGGGTACAYSSINGAKLMGKFYCSRSDLLAIGAFGSASVIPAGTSTNENLIFVKNAANAVEGTSGTFVKTRFNPRRAGTVTVTSPDGITTYVAGTDYIVVEGGLLIPPDSTIPNAVASGTPPAYTTPNARVTYQYADQVRVQGLTNAGTDQVIWISGFDDASGNDFSFVAYRCRPMPKAIPLIKNDWAALDLEFTLLPDQRGGFSGESLYFQMSVSEA